MRAGQSQVVESALWTALRSLEESIALTRRLATRSREARNARSAEIFEERAKDLDEHAAVIRQLLVDSPVGAEQ